jgi:predicted small secreted protein
VAVTALLLGVGLQVWQVYLFYCEYVRRAIKHASGEEDLRLVAKVYDRQREVTLSFIAQATAPYSGPQRLDSFRA